MIIVLFFSLVHIKGVKREAPFILPSLATMDDIDDRERRIKIAGLGVAAAIIAHVLEILEGIRPMRRRLWTRQWLLRRPQYGQYEKLMAELKREQPTDYKNFLRMDAELFSEIVRRVGPAIAKGDTFMRKCLEPGIKIAITLRYLATGESYMSLQYSFRVARCTITKLIPVVCDAIADEYKNEVMKCPSTAEEWKAVARDYGYRWNFHHAVGAIDGKHVAIRCPPKQGSNYFNYKGFHSIVLLAVVDANYKFLYVDIGANGCCSDAGIFKTCSFFDALDGKYAGLPAPESLPNDDQDVPYFLVADEAFALRTWMMKPFPSRLLERRERICNYRLSRARRVVENAFGILVSRYV